LTEITAERTLQSFLQYNHLHIADF